MVSRLDSLLISSSRRQKGVTFIELLISIAVLAILVGIAAPYFGDYIERQRLVGAAEAVYGQLQQAKQASVSNNKSIFFQASSIASGNWCTGYSELNNCNCITGTNCEINGQSTVLATATDYPDISVLNKNTPASTAMSLEFSMPGLNADGGTIVARSSRVGDIEIVISTVGRIRICSDDVISYPDC